MNVYEDQVVRYKLHNFYSLYDQMFSWKSNNDDDNYEDDDNADEYEKYKPIKLRVD